MTSHRKQGYDAIPNIRHEEDADEEVEQRLEISPEDVDTAATARRLTGRALLLLVAFLYGTLSVTLRGVYALPDPPSASALSTTRGWMAALCFLPFLVVRRQGTQPAAPQEEQPEQKLHQKSLLMVSIELAAWNFGAQGLQNVGLLYISSARAAFFTQTSVVLTPVISALAGHHVHSKIWVACAVALSGLMLLSGSSNDDENSGEGKHFFFGTGDLLCLGGALCWSLYIYRLSHCGTFDEINMQAIKTFFLAVFYTMWFLVASARSEVGLWLGYGSVLAWVLIFYSALGPGAVADIIQQAGQACVSASEANVILSMEPLFTAFLGRVLLGEATSLQEKLGGGLIIVAALLASSVS